GLRGLERLVPGSHRRAAADLILYSRQDLRDTHAADPVPGAGSPVFGRLPGDPLPVAAGGRLSVDAGAQFAAGILRRINIEPHRANRSLYLRRLCQRRHGRGNRWNCHYGTDRMACRMARSRKGPAGRVAGSVLMVLALCSFASGQEAPAPPPFSQECSKGGEALVAETPLPNVAADLASHRTIKILTIGSSAAAGRRAIRGGYTRLIEEILERAIKGIDVVMINRGVSGELAANAAARMKIEVALNRPDLVLWQVGTNDALAYVPLSQITMTVVDTIQWLRRHKVDVILVGLQYVEGMLNNPHYVAVRDELRRIAARENVVIVRRDEAMRLINQAKHEGGVPLPDEFEQTEAGYT